MSSNVEAELEEFEEGKNKRTWILLALALGLTILVGGLLDLFTQGILLGFTITIFNETATLSVIIYHVSVITAGA